VVEIPFTPPTDSPNIEAGVNIACVSMLKFVDALRTAKIPMRTDAPCKVGAFINVSVCCPAIANAKDA